MSVVLLACLAVVVMVHGFEYLAVIVLHVKVADDAAQFLAAGVAQVGGQGRVTSGLWLGQRQELESSQEVRREAGKGESHICNGREDLILLCPLSTFKFVMQSLLLQF